METDTLNEKYYNKLYKRRNIIFNAIYPFISYDQQSKSNANYSLLKSVIKVENIRVLDYGFGHGSFLLKFPKSSSLFGVDISEEAVANFPKTARFFGKKAMTSTPDNIDKIIEPGTMDVICLSHVLEHVEDDNATLVKMRHFLRDKGRLLLNIPINEVWDDPKHVRSYDLETVKQLLEKSGFRMVTYFMFDKITAFLLEYEKNRMDFPGKKNMFRGLRFFLSFISFKFFSILDKYIFKHYLDQQLVVLAEKK